MADATEDQSEEQDEGQEPTGSDGREPEEEASSPPDLDAATPATASVLPDPEDLNLVCDMSADLCQQACAAASCCFEAEESPAQCLDDANCAGYSPCSKFYVGS